MNILGLIEMHPFDGSDAFICLRIQNNAGNLFDFPITEEQLRILTDNMASPVASKAEPAGTEDYSKYEPTASSFSPKKQPREREDDDDDDDVLVLNANRQYSMGHNTSWDMDDDL
jgi:hypothetical protein